MKGFVMTARLAEVLAELCDVDTVRMNLASLEELQDFVLAAPQAGREKETIGWLCFLRTLRSVFVKIDEALVEEGGEA